MKYTISYNDEYDDNYDDKYDLFIETSIIFK